MFPNPEKPLTTSTSPHIITRWRIITVVSLGIMVVLSLMTWNAQRQAQTQAEQAAIIQATAAEEATARTSAVTREAQARGTAEAAKDKLATAQTQVVAERNARQAANAHVIFAYAQGELAQRTDPSGSLALLLAREAVLTYRKAGLPVSVEADETLRQAVDAAPPWRMTLPASSDWIRSVALSPDGKTILTAGSYKIPRIWDVTTGQMVRRFVGHSDAVHLAAFGADGRLVITDSSDGTARVWDTATGQELRRLVIEGETQGDAFSPTANLYVVSDNDGDVIRVWDIVTGKERYRLTSQNDLILPTGFSPDGSLFGSYNEEGTQIWDMATGKKVRQLPGWQPTFSPDGRLIFTKNEGTIRIWKVATWEELPSVPGNKAIFSPDSRLIVTWGQLNPWTMWDTASGKEVRQLPRPIMNGSYEVSEIAFSPDGVLMATVESSDKVLLQEVSSGKELHRLDFGHGYGIDLIGFSPDISILVTLQDKMLRIWNTHNGQGLPRSAGHSASVTAAAFSPDQKLIVTASDDHTARIWDARTGEELHQLLGHRHSVSAAIFSPDGQRIVTFANYEPARVWDAPSGRMLYEVGDEQYITSAAFSPDGKLIVTGGSSSLIKVWDSDKGQEVRQLRSSGGDSAAWVDSLAFSPDGNQVLAVSCEYYGRDPYGCNEWTTQLWDIRSGQELAKRSSDSIDKVSFSPNGPLLATTNEDGTVSVLDIQGDRELFSLPSSGTTFFSPDGRLIATRGEEIVRLWDTQTGQELHQFTNREGIYGSIIFSPDNNFMVTINSNEPLSYGQARLWDTRTGQELSYLTDRANAAAFSPDGSFIITANSDGTAQIWNTIRGKDRRRLAGPSSFRLTGQTAAFSLDGQRIALVKDKIVQVYDFATGKELLQLVGHSNLVNSVTMSRDGHFIATANQDFTARIWNADNGQELQQFEHPQEVESVAFSPDERMVATGGSDNMVRIWDTESGTVLHQLDHDNDNYDYVNFLAFSPDGKMILSASSNGTARVWEAESGKELHHLGTVQQGHHTAAFSPDGRLLLIDGWDDNIAPTIWDVSTGKELLQLTGHDSPANSVAFSPDGNLIVTTSDRRTIQVWNTKSGVELRRLTDENCPGVTQINSVATRINSAIFSPDGHWILSACEDGQATLCFATIDDLRTEAQALIQRDPPELTPEERARFIP